MVTAVAFDYLAGIVAGLVVLVVGWRRFVRGPRTDARPRPAAELTYYILR